MIVIYPCVAGHKGSSYNTVFCFMHLVPVFTSYHVCNFVGDVFLVTTIIGGLNISLY